MPYAVIGQNDKSKMAAFMRSEMAAGSNVAFNKVSF